MGLLVGHSCLVSGTTLPTASCHAPSTRAGYARPVDAPPTAGVVAGSLVGGYALARFTGVRPLGGVVLVAGGAWCASQWVRTAGPLDALGLLAVLGASFVGAHPLAKRIGAWPSVLGVATAAAATTWATADRRARRLI